MYQEREERDFNQLNRLELSLDYFLLHTDEPTAIKIIAVNY